MTFPCPHCGGEIVTSAAPTTESEILRRLLQKQPPWSVVGAEDREGQQAYRRKPAVYVLLGDADEPLYIGKTQEPTWRWQQHRRMRPWWGAVQQIAVLVMSDIHSAYVTEQRLIQRLQPQFNIRGR